MLPISRADLEGDMAKFYGAYLQFWKVQWMYVGMYDGRITGLGDAGHSAQKLRRPASVADFQMPRWRSGCHHALLDSDGS